VKSPIPCASCGDPAEIGRCCIPPYLLDVPTVDGTDWDQCALLHAGKPRCLTCLKELRLGIVPGPSCRAADGGKRADSGRQGLREDDAGPWSQNALRHMEGD
jgi:hypothetical protein